MASASEHVVKHQRHLDNCPLLSVVDVLCAFSDESIETASWSTFFMADGSKIKSKTGCTVSSGFCTSTRRFQGDAFHKDISQVEHRLQFQSLSHCSTCSTRTERQCLDARVDVSLLELKMQIRCTAAHASHEAERQCLEAEADVLLVELGVQIRFFSHCSTCSS